MFNTVLIRLQDNVIIGLRNFGTFEKAEYRMRQEARAITSFKGGGTKITQRNILWEHFGITYEMRIITNGLQLVGLRYADDLREEVEFAKRYLR